MTSIYFHIGTHKTATSSIQRFLLESSDLLEKNGFQYLKPPVQLQAKKYFNTTNHNFLVELIKQGNGIVRKYIEENWDKSRNLIISAENFYASCLNIALLEKKSVDEAFLIEEVFIEQLRRELEGYQLTILVFLRDPMKFYESFYRQIVKNVRGNRFSLKELIRRNHYHLANYVAIINLWEKYFEASNIKSYPFPNKLHNPIENFCLILGISLEEINTDFQENTKKLNRSGVFFKRIINTIPLPWIGSYWIHKLFLSSPAFLQKKGKSDFLISDSQAKFILRKIDEYNVNKS